MNLVWVGALTRGTGFLDHEDIIPTSLHHHTDEETQLRSRLHTYFGLTHADARHATRVATRAFVYSLRNYRPQNDFGPFLLGDPSSTEGLSVNWVHVQALHHVMSMHSVELNEDDEFDFIVYRMSLPYTQIIIPPGVDLDSEEDWAGVEGKWKISFCFCDHRELIAYNATAETESDPLDPSLFVNPHFQEVFRTLEVRFEVSHTTPDPSYPSRPKIFYTGQMGMGSGYIMNGWVRMTKDEQVQWHFVSGDHGHTIWSSEGVQVGGVRSSFGILGAWTTVFHDGDDPVGPFWARKVLETDDDASPSLD